MIGSPLEFLAPVPFEVFQSSGSVAILQGLAIEAPETVDGVVVISSTWRPAPSGAAFSWHNKAEAIDWRTGLYLDASGTLALGSRRGSIVAPSPLEGLDIAKSWAGRLSLRLGVTFDVVFGDQKHIDHGHAERDGRKVARVFGG